MTQKSTHETSSTHNADDEYYRDKIFHITGVKMQIDALLRMRNCVTA